MKEKKMSLHDTNTQNQNLPPRALATDQEQAVFSASTSAAAASADLWTGYAVDAGGSKTPMGKCWLELEALGASVYVRFTRTALTATTTANGAVIPVGTTRRFYVDPTKDLFIDHIASGAGTIKWRRVGSIIERGRQ